MPDPVSWLVTWYIGEIIDQKPYISRPDPKLLNSMVLINSSENWKKQQVEYYAIDPWDGLRKVDEKDKKEKIKRGASPFYLFKTPSPLP
ncbi:MAG: hypothetical protein ACREOW_18860 [Thermodesulfobacteriota bacterium]